MIDGAARDRVWVRGPDAASYLQSQVSQELGDLDVGAERWTFVLDPTGKVDALARIGRVSDEAFLLDTDAGFGDVLAARLARFKIRVAAELETEPADRAEPSDEHETVRISAGWPRSGREILPGDTIPAALGIEQAAVSFTKGCYPGQELVERMNSRGAAAPRTLRIVEVGRGAAPGDPVTDAAGEVVGELTSVAPEGGVALAMVKRGSDVGRPAGSATSE